ncbi:MAG: type II toxin-antitoxin system Phd/YefM family antitoxin [Pseudomonadota bacterium]|jgi:prevent-host-death family protein
MQNWPIQEAKARFSALVRAAEHDGPQAITWHGREVAVVVSRAEYERLTGAGESLVEFMRRSPLYGVEDIEFGRDASLPRDTPL